MISCRAGRINTVVPIHEAQLDVHPDFGLRCRLLPALDSPAPYERHPGRIAESERKAKEWIAEEASDGRLRSESHRHFHRARDQSRRAARRDIKPGSPMHLPDDRSHNPHNQHCCPDDPLENPFSPERPIKKPKRMTRPGSDTQDNLT